MTGIEAIDAIVTMATGERIGEEYNGKKYYYACTVIVRDKEWHSHRKLKRWAGDFVIGIDGNDIVYNSLIQRAWNFDESAAFEEANNAIEYFLRQQENDPTTIEVEVIKD